MTAGVIVGRILLARDDLLGVVQLAVGTRADLVTHGRLEVNQDSAGHVLSGTWWSSKRGVRGRQMHHDKDGIKYNNRWRVQD